ncbi:MAG: thiol-disulfide oxidoreductase DCC family protein [Myxococcota bacterium]|nr:thiol-disulfide oxidoreductase DCC family protein [Myxococcota bacterium]
MEANPAPLAEPALPDVASHPLVLIDGVCNLCHAAVRFLVPRDPEARYRFASIQSPLGSRLMRAHGLDPESLDSVVLIDSEGAHGSSTAVLRILRGLPGIWRLAALGLLLPRALRDRAYGFVSRHRYRWFGRRDACALPTAALRDRFLD